MALEEFGRKLDELIADAKTLGKQVKDSAALEAFRVTFLGAKNGRLKSVQEMLKSVLPADKPTAGKRFNEVKAKIEEIIADVKAHIAAEHTNFDAGPKIDVTLPGKPLRVGHVHPITQTIDELKDIMGRLGFTVAVGPEIEDEWHNFQALNIPASHPARDPLENFYLATAGKLAGGSSPLLLRSQTSTVQIRVMEQTKPPVRIISLGRVYRPDTADATHYPMFHQIEGLLIDKHVTMADLKSVLRLFAQSYLGRDVHIRFRPSFFPFTEPSVEVDMSWDDKWIEMGGAGMVDPNVLKAVGYDPEEVSGFAFGLGVERVCARRHGVTDIREFYKNDVRFLHQF
jgi:phenylalanyl-tRNA synthetase alpha chain